MTSAPMYDEQGERIWHLTDDDSIREFCLDLQQITIANFEARAGITELIDAHEDDSGT